MLTSPAAWALASFLGKSTPFHPRPAPFIGLFAIGFIVAMIGHIYRAKTVIVTGLIMIFCATIVLPLGLYLSSR